MKAKDISSLYGFCLAVEHGGFAAASLRSRVSAPTLSRAVAQLEETLGEKLVHRSAKQFRTTAAGDDCYQRFAPLLKQLEDQWGLLSNTQPALAGDIRVSCPEPFADGFLQQTAIEFMRLHPGVTIHIEFSSDTNHFFDDQIDLAVATNPPKAPHLIQRRLFDMELSLAASPDYLAQHSRPSRAEDLLQHHLLAGNRLPFWEFRENSERVRIPLSPKYSVDSLRLVIQAACAGMGICLIPKATLLPLAGRGQLERLLPQVACPTGVVYLVWADRQLVSARVKAFREMILARLNDPTGFLSALSCPSAH